MSDIAPRSPPVSALPTINGWLSRQRVVVLHRTSGRSLQARCFREYAGGMAREAQEPPLQAAHDTRTISAYRVKTFCTEKSSFWSPVSWMCGDPINQWWSGATSSRSFFCSAALRSQPAKPC